MKISIDKEYLIYINNNFNPNREIGGVVIGNVGINTINIYEMNLLHYKFIDSNNSFPNKRIIDKNILGYFHSHISGSPTLSNNDCNILRFNSIMFKQKLLCIVNKYNSGTLFTFYYNKNRFTKNFDISHLFLDNNFNVI